MDAKTAFFFFIYPELLEGPGTFRGVVALPSSEHVGDQHVAMLGHFC